MNKARLKAGNKVLCLDDKEYISKGQISNYAIHTSEGFKYFKEPGQVYQPNSNFKCHTNDLFYNAVECPNCGCVVDIDGIIELNENELDFKEKF